MTTEHTHDTQEDTIDSLKVKISELKIMTQSNLIEYLNTTSANDSKTIGNLYKLIHKYIAFIKDARYLIIAYIFITILLMLLIILK